jgi:trimeric autotransporter adhesin
MKKATLLIWLVCCACFAMAQPITGPNKVCVGSTITVTDGSAGGTWVSSTPLVGAIGTSTGVITGISGGTTTITYNFSGGGFTVYPVTVSPIPPLISGTSTVCAGATTTLTDVVAGGVWTSSNPTIAFIGSNTGLVSGLAVGTATITYTIGGICTTTMTTTVIPSPVAYAVTGGGTYCTGSPCPHIGLSNSQVGVTYQLFCSGVPVGTAVAGTGAAIDFGIFCTACTYTIVGTSSVTGCSTTMTGNAIVAVSTPCIIGGPNLVCVGSTINLTGCSGCTWSSGNPSIATVGACTGVVTGISAGVTTITYTSGFGCISTYSVTVNTPASLSSTLTPPGICSGTLFSYTPTSTTPGVVFSWTRAFTPGISNPPASGTGNPNEILNNTTSGPVSVTYTYTLTVGGCITTQSVTVIVTPAPPIKGPDTLCIGTAIQYHDTLTGGIWSSSNPTMGSIGTAGIAVGLSAGTITLTYSLPSGCIATKTVVVYLCPCSVICANGDFESPSVGSGISVHFPETGVTCWHTTDISSTIELWSASGSGVATPSGLQFCELNSWSGNTTLWTDFTGVAGNSYTVYFFHKGRYSVSDVMSMYVDNYPYSSTPTYTLPVPGSSATFINNYTADFTQWNYHSATFTLTNPNARLLFHSISSGGAVDGGNFIDDVVITLAIQPIAGPDQLCVGDNITESNPNPCGSWSSSNVLKATVGATTGIVHGVAAGVVNITYTNCLGCYTIKTITVNPLPTACTITGGGVYGPCDSCPSVSLSCSQVGISYQLYRFPGAVIAGPPVPGTGSPLNFGAQCTPGTYYIVATNPVTGCTNTMTGTVTVTYRALPTVFTVTGGGNYCPGTTCPNVGLSGSQLGVRYQIYCGTTPVLPVVNGTGGAISFGPECGPCTYKVVATDTITGCKDTMTGSAVVMPYPPCPIYGPTTVCVGDTIILLDSCGGGHWSSLTPGCAVVGSSGVVTPISTVPCTAIITYTSSLGCVSTYPVTVMTAPPTPTITGGPTSLCIGQTATFTGSPIPPGCSSGWFTWGVGGPFGTLTYSGTSASYLGTGSGIESINYLVWNTCGNRYASITVSVDMLPPITGPMHVCAGLTIPLSDAALGGTWSCGTGGTITIGGVFTGVTPGTCVVTYTTAAGCSVSVTITIDATPTISGTLTVCAGQTTTLTPSPVVTGSTWTLVGSAATGSGTSSSITLTGSAPGTETVTYTTPAGCTATVTVTVFPIPQIIHGPDTICVGSAYYFDETTPGGTWSINDPTKGSISSSTGVTVTITGLATGTFVVKYTLPSGCVVTHTVCVTVCPCSLLCYNSDFESPVLPFGTPWHWYPQDSIPCWNTTDTFGTIEVWDGAATGYPAISGNQYIEINSQSVSAVYTDFNATGVSNINIGFLHRARYPSANDNDRMEVWIQQAPFFPLPTHSNPIPFGSIYAGTVTENDEQWHYHSIPFTLPIGPSNFRIYFRSVAVTGGIPDGGNFLDDVSVNQYVSPIYGPAAICAGSTITMHDDDGTGNWTCSPGTLASIDPTGHLFASRPGTVLVTYTLPSGCHTSYTVRIDSCATTCPNNVICDGDFETPLVTGLNAVHNFMWYTPVSGDCWFTFETDNEIEYRNSGAISNQQFIELNAEKVGTVYQDFNVTAPGGILKFAHKGRYATPDRMFVRILTDNGNTTYDIGDFLEDNTQWVYYPIPVGALSGQSRILFYSISSPGSAVGGGNYLDDVSLCITTGVSTPITKTADNTIKVFPNPTNGTVTLSSGKAFTNARIRVMSITGQEILSKDNVTGDSYTFDLTPFTSGMYIVEVSENGNNFRSKIVKE